MIMLSATEGMSHAEIYEAQIFVVVVLFIQVFSQAKLIFLDVGDDTDDNIFLHLKRRLSLDEFLLLKCWEFFEKILYKNFL